jgi:hypothetical protein
MHNVPEKKMPEKISLACDFWSIQYSFFTKPKPSSLFLHHAINSKAETGIKRQSRREAIIQKVAAVPVKTKKMTFICNFWSH